jgi:hypothetical protein
MLQFEKKPGGGAEDRRTIVPNLSSARPFL